MSLCPSLGAPLQGRGLRPLRARSRLMGNRMGRFRLRGGSLEHIPPRWQGVLEVVFMPQPFGFTIQRPRLAQSRLVTHSLLCFPQADPTVRIRQILGKPVSEGKPKSRVEFPRSVLRLRPAEYISVFSVNTTPLRRTYLHRVVLTNLRANQIHLVNPVCDYVKRAGCMSAA